MGPVLPVPPRCVRRMLHHEVIYQLLLQKNEHEGAQYPLQTLDFSDNTIRWVNSWVSAYSLIFSTVRVPARTQVVRVKI